MYCELATGTCCHFSRSQDTQVQRSRHRAGVASLTSASESFLSLQLWVLLAQNSQYLGEKCSHQASEQRAAEPQGETTSHSKQVTKGVTILATGTGPDHRGETGLLLHDG